MRFDRSYIYNIQTHRAGVGDHKQPNTDQQQRRRAFYFPFIDRFINHEHFNSLEWTFERYITRHNLSQCALYTAEKVLQHIKNHITRWPAMQLPHQFRRTIIFYYGRTTRSFYGALFRLFSAWALEEIRIDTQYDSLWSSQDRRSIFSMPFQNHMSWKELLSINVS